MNYWEVSLMDCQIKITDNKAVWKIQAALALIFLLNPFLGVLSTLFFCFCFKRKINGILLGHYSYLVHVVFAVYTVIPFRRAE